MSGLAIGSFVDGFFRGDDWKTRHRERKADRERQTRMDDAWFEDRDRRNSREDETDSRTRWEHGQRVQSVQRAEQERQAWAASMGIIAPGSDAPVGEPAPPPAGPASTALGAIPPAAVAATAAPVPGSMAPPQRPGGPAQGPMPLPPEQGPPIMPPEQGPMPPVSPVGMVEPGVMAAPGVPMGAPGVPQVDPRVAQVARQGAPMGIIPPGADRTPYGDIDHLYAKLAAYGETPRTLMTMGQSQPAVDLVMNPPGPVTPDMQAAPAGPGPMSTGQPPEWDRQAAAAHAAAMAQVTPQTNGAPQRMDAPIPMGAPQRPDAAPAAMMPPPTEGQPIAPTPTEAPSTTAARGAVRDTAPPPAPADARPGSPEAQRPSTIAEYPERTVRRVSDSVVDQWRQTGLPQMQRFYLETGQIDKLDALNQWADAEQTRSGMRSWGKAIFAAELGDFDAFKEAIIDSYNNLDYFGDDMSIVADKSDFIRDGENIVGARLTFRDATGRESVQEFMGPDDLLLQGINMLAPEAAFEFRLKQMEAQNTSQARMAEEIFKDAMKRGAPPDIAQKITDMVAERAKADPVQFGQLPPDQQVAQVVELLRAIAAATQGGAGGGAAPAGPLPVPQW